MSYRNSRQSSRDTPTTLLDRLGMAILSGVLAFLSGIMIWGAIALGRYGGGILLPFDFVLWFTAVMTVLGFLTAENLLVTIFGKVWYALYVLVAEEKPPKSP